MLNLKKSVLITFIVLFGHGVFAVYFNGITFSGTKYIYIRDVAKYYGMTVSQNSKFCYLKSQARKIVFEFPKKNAEINGVAVNLLFPADYNSGNSIISEKDFQLVLEPIMNPGVIKKQRVKTIVIDPGHGGEDHGTHGAYSMEKNITLSIAKKVAQQLSSKGYKVIMTRNSDKPVEVHSRPSVISRYGADMFISIHANSAKRSISGIETFILAPNGTSSTYTKNIVHTRENGNSYDLNNAKLGYEIQKSLNRIGREDRGLKHARFAVLRGATKPAVLIETGFLSNRGEEKLLNSIDYQNNIARCITSGIISYAKATMPEMASLPHITVEGVNYHLKKLKKTGLLKRVVGRKRGYWKV